jgi:hypothetical protein
MIEIIVEPECYAPVWWNLAECRADRPACFRELLMDKAVLLSEAEATAFYRWADTVPGWHPQGSSAWFPEPVKYRDTERNELDPDYWQPAKDVP